MACVALCATIIVAPSLMAQGDGRVIPIIVPNEEELLLCALNLERETLSEELEVYSTARGMMLPLGEVCRLLDFNISVEPVKGTAKGWLADSGHSFELDMASEAIRIDGAPARYVPSLVEAHANDIFVESALLGEWLGIPLDANRYAAAVTLWPKGKLPIQLRLAREKRGSNTWGYGLQKGLDYPRKDQPYTILGGASLDFSISNSLYSTAQNISASPLYFNMLMTGDILWMNGYLAFTGKADSSGFQPETMHMALRRMDPDGNLLGSLRAREFAIGDIAPVSPSLLGSAGTSTGIAVGNYPLASPSYFDLQTLEGYLMPGWDVELYRDDTLLDYRKTSQDGEQYQFKDIPLLFGKNVLTLVFHGPMGQKKTEEHIYNVGTNMIQPGSYSYRASATLDDLGPRLGFQQVYGLSKALTLRSFLVSPQQDGGRNLYAGLGAAGYFQNIQADGSAAIDLRHGGLAGDLGVRTQVKNAGLSFRVYAYDMNWALADPDDSSPPYVAKGIFRADNLRWTQNKAFSPLSLSFTHISYRDGGQKNLAELSQTHSMNSLRFHHKLTLEHEDNGAGTDSVELSGSSWAIKTFPSARLEGELKYTFFPQPAIDTAGLSWDVALPLSIQLNGNVYYDFADDIFSSSVYLYRNIRPAKIGFVAHWRSSGDWSVGLTAAVNISRDGRNGAVVLDSQPLAGKASISARVFVDTNRNGVWDGDEKPLEGVGFLVNDRSHATLTGPDGIAFLQGLTPDIVTNVSISTVTLEDILMVPACKGLSCVPRPGYATALDFPVWLTGEITGTIYVRKDGVVTDSPGVNVEILDESGTIVTTTRSAYDGYYSFEELPTGLYTVRIKGGKAAAEGEYITASAVIPPAGGYCDYVDLTYDEVGDT